MLLEFGLANFEGTQLERQVFTMLLDSPHPNLVRCLDANWTKVPGHLDSIIFFERLDLLSTALADSSMKRRRRWAVELASAFSHLELLGLMPTKTYACDLGLDKEKSSSRKTNRCLRIGRLKLVGFGASPRRSGSAVDAATDSTTKVHERYNPSAEVTRENMASAHQRLASCLHYILSGVDPDGQAREIGHARHSQTDRRQWREMMVRRGEYPIAAGAEPIAEIVQDAWALKMAAGGEARSFKEVEEKIRDAFRGLEVEHEAELQLANGTDYGLLEERCHAWLEAQEQEPRWLAAAEYEEAVREAMAGYDA
ncbi:hypothetical protein diail_2178 [Diaporthe ilicicola]|nr:hypothetical protein diail_2178 [Diaporthe ilicicola]